MKIKPYDWFYAIVVTVLVFGASGAVAQLFFNPPPPFLSAPQLTACKGALDLSVGCIIPGLGP